jgi:hypothetical protein
MEQAMTPPADLLALAKAWVNSYGRWLLCKEPREKDARKADVDAHESAFTSALAAQQANFTAAEMTIASFENRVSDLREKIATLDAQASLAEKRREEIERLREACESAIEWLDGWASAEPYVTILRDALGGTPAAGVWMPCLTELQARTIERLAAECMVDFDGAEQRLRHYLAKLTIAAKP